MKKYIFLSILIVVSILGCKDFPGKSNPDAIVLDANGFHLNGTIISREELSTYLQEKSSNQDTSLITVELLPGYINDHKFDLKFMLKDNGIKNVKEIK